MNLERLLIDKIENRILVGIVTFVGVMIIIGWISINEPARMAAFEDQYDGRAIERVGYLFSQNCSTCHGIDGRGRLGQAPGLNSPHLFGYDFMAAEHGELEIINRDLEPAQAIVSEYEKLEEAISSGESEDPDADLIRFQELDAQIADARATVEELEGQAADIQAELDAFAAQVQAAVDKGYNPDIPNRLDQVGWAGSLDAYVLTTLIHGRPGSQNYWPRGQNMAAWGQIAGGPLRHDQLEDLTAYIMNWDKDWTLEDLLAVNQFGIVPGGEPPSGDGIGTTDVDAILDELANYTGDPNNGQTIYNGAYACAGCHGNEVVAPPTALTWLAATDGEGGRPYAGDPEHYVVESIVNPGAFVVSPYPTGAMPANFADRLSYQELADIVAYLSSFDG